MTAERSDSLRAAMSAVDDAIRNGPRPEALMRLQLEALVMQWDYWSVEDIKKAGATGDASGGVAFGTAAAQLRMVLSGNASAVVEP